MPTFIHQTGQFVFGGKSPGQAGFPCHTLGTLKGLVKRQVFRNRTLPD
jgi:hypothetical protein